MCGTLDGSAKNYDRIGTKCLAEPSNLLGQQFGQTSRFGHRNLAESSSNKKNNTKCRWGTTRSTYTVANSTNPVPAN